MHWIADAAVRFQGMVTKPHLSLGKTPYFHYSSIYTGVQLQSVVTR